MNKTINIIKYVGIITVLVLAIFAVGKTASAACEMGPIYPGSSIWGCVGQNSDNGDDDDDDNDSGNGNLNVSTLSASSIDSDSATLRGEITDLDSSEDYERFFEWGTDEDDLDHTLSISGTTDDEGEFSRTLTGLSDDREYFYRACAENSDDSNDDDCGSVRSFTTDDEGGSSNNNSNNGGDEAVLTTDASAIGYNTAILNGVVVNEGGSQTVWFEWGRTVNLGNRTAARTVSDDQSLVSVNLSGLSSSTSYFFRIVSNSGEAGDIKAFTTRSFNAPSTPAPTNNPTNPPTHTTPDPEVIVVQTNTISSDEFLNVDLVSSLKDAKSGDTVMFQAVYENLTDTTLKNIKLVVDMPVGIEIKNTESGTIMGQRVEFTIPALGANESDSFAIETRISSKSADKFLVGIIEAIFDHPALENTRIDIVDYAIVKILRGTASSSNSDHAAGAAFAGTFFPKGIGGWLILAGSIILLIVLARKLYKEKEDEKKKEEDKMKPGLKIAK